MYLWLDNYQKVTRRTPSNAIDWITQFEGSSQCFRSVCQQVSGKMSHVQPAHRFRSTPSAELVSIEDLSIESSDLLKSVRKQLSLERSLLEINWKISFISFEWRWFTQWISLQLGLEFSKFAKFQLVSWTVWVSKMSLDFHKWEPCKRVKTKCILRAVQTCEHVLSVASDLMNFNFKKTF